MKQRLLHLQLLLLVALLGVPLGAWADRDVNQQQFGKQVIEVASDEVITFYDPWGTENIVDNNSYNVKYSNICTWDNLYVAFYAYKSYIELQ